MDITELLTFAKKNEASDIHLSTNNPPVLRIHGDILPMKSPPLTAEQVKTMLYAVMTEQQRSDYERELEVDFSVSLGDTMRFRVNAFFTMHGPAAVMRDIPTRVHTLDDLGAPFILKKLCELKKGIVLVTGPTGSGKSTTLAAMIDHINRNFCHHILTIEDPIEFVHKSQRSLVNQREVGGSTRDFDIALRSALREDPDVILVGEMRDLKTIRLALSAAETGHLVMGTLHTNSAPKTIDRIIDVFPSSEKEMIRAMLAGSLEAVITQCLLKRMDNNGRVACHEILLGTSGVRNLIREGKIPQLTSLMQMGSKIGMQTMRDTLLEMVNNQIISDDTMKSVMASSGDDKGDLKEQAAKAEAESSRATGF